MVLGYGIHDKNSYLKTVSCLFWVVILSWPVLPKSPFSFRLQHWYNILIILCFQDIIYISLYIYIYIYVYIYVYIYMYIYMYISICICLYTYIEYLLFIILKQQIDINGKYLYI